MNPSISDSYITLSQHDGLNLVMITDALATMISLFNARKLRQTKKMTQLKLQEFGKMIFQILYVNQ